MLKIAAEMIDYQIKDAFPGELSYLVSCVYKEIDSGKYKDISSLLNGSSNVTKIEKLFKDRFGMLVVFDRELTKYMPAAIIPFMSSTVTELGSANYIDKSYFTNLFSGISIFKHIKKITTEREKQLREIHNRKGSVSLKHAKVTGYLSEVKHLLLIDFMTLKLMELTADEVTAVILHELGHAFTGLENHHNLFTTNSTIMDILGDLNNNKLEQAQYKFKRHFNGKDLVTSATGGDGTERVDYYGKLAKTYIGHITSQVMNSKYDETDYENMADSFCVRFGRSKDLTTALHKIHQSSGMVHSNSSVVYGTMLTLDILTNLLIIALLGTALSGAFSLLMIGLYLGMSVGVTQNDSLTHMTYDFPIDRYVRIRNGVINNLKDKSLPPELAKKLIKDFEYIDSVIKESLYYKPVLNRLSQIIVPTNRDNTHYIELQQIIENSLNNPVFVSSQKIRTI